MLQLHPDLNFHYETMRALGLIPYGGADLSEVLGIMDKIKSGDFDSWYEEWFKLAQRVLATVDEKNEASYSPVTLRNVYFRASHYFFVADFFLHGNKSDPRMPKCYELWTKYFNKANALLPIPGKHVTIQADGFEMRGMVFRASAASASSPRPTVIFGGGFESVLEETYHVFVPAALERGYNVVLYEGPGHRSLVNQGKGFIAEWEKAVNPVVDFIMANKSKDLDFVDTDKIGLVGMSLGGYLAARAAAFEPRLAAVMLFDGVWSFLETILAALPDLKDAWVKGDKKEFDRIFEERQHESTNRRWFHDDILYTFCKDSGFEACEVIAKMTLDNGVAERIRMPAWVGDATDDMFFEGQPGRVVDRIGSHAVLKKFGPEGLGAQLHCQSGALIYSNQDMMEWFASVVGH